LRIAPTGYRFRTAQLRDSSQRCARAKRNEFLCSQINRVWQGNMQFYGADNVWEQLNREGITGTRCTVERLN
jgi:hypothetical protein